jgi:hypothetical protein
LPRAAIEFARSELNSNIVERDAQQVFSREGWRKRAGSDLGATFWKVVEPTVNCIGITKRKPEATDEAAA